MQAAYEQLALEETSRRERLDEIRQAAWEYAVGTRTSYREFWRHGFAARWGAKVEKHDYTVIPNYDLIADHISEHYPEFSGTDGAERLFDFLLSPYIRRTTTAELWQQAVSWVLSEQIEYTPHGDAAPCELEEAPF